MPHLSPVAAREIVHLAILRELMRIRGGDAVTVKGGVNLRLFFGSPRYSEDMDLDGTAQASDTIRDALKGLVEDASFARGLRPFGIRELDPGEGPNKDTDTTFRHKFGVVVSGGIRYPTKVEVSFRGRHGTDRTAFESPAPEMLQPYGMDRFEIRHYVREAAVRQKLGALAGRREAQARDVFDLYMLVPGAAADDLIRYLAKHLSTSTLHEGHSRALAITYEEYVGQVIEFLGEQARATHNGEAAWDEMRLHAVGLIERVMMLQEGR
ncbi:MAG: nucleotidyl transferase AbiEii/AbiGii toxin family protein [Gemmatimonadota bacterium]|nr:nucleotidyl transferase AbiEii/AbiGii toxin family protein [Gemmatimonadota bacterium]